MADILDFARLFVAYTWPFWAGMVSFWFLVILMILVGRWLDARQLARWKHHEKGATELPRYTRSILAGALSPEEVESVSPRALDVDGVSIEWDREGFHVQVDGERYNLGEERFTRIQLSRMSDPAVPYWWFGEGEQRDWLGVVLRFGSHEVRLKSAVPVGWAVDELPELQQEGPEVPLPKVLAMLEAAAFLEIPVAEHRMGERQEDDAPSRPETVAESHASWLYPILTPAAALVTLALGAIGIKIVWGITGFNYLHTVLAGLFYGSLFAMMGGALFGLITSRFTRRLVRAMVWPDAAGPRNRRYNHHLRFSMALMAVWFSVGALVGVGVPLVTNQWSMPLVGSAVGLAIYLTHRLLTSSLFVFGPAEAHRTGPHVAFEYAPPAEAGR